MHGIYQNRIKLRTPIVGFVQQKHTFLLPLQGQHCVSDKPECPACHSHLDQATTTYPTFTIPPIKKIDKIYQLSQGR